MVVDFKDEERAFVELMVSLPEYFKREALSSLIYKPEYDDMFRDHPRLKLSPKLLGVVKEMEDLSRSKKMSDLEDSGKLDELMKFETFEEMEFSEILEGNRAEKLEIMSKVRKLEKLERNRRIEENKILKHLQAVFDRVAAPEIFAYRHLSNYEVLGLRRYFYFTPSSIVPDSPYVTRQIAAPPDYVLELALPPIESFVTRHLQVLDRDRDKPSPVSFSLDPDVGGVLIPVTPILFRGNNGMSRFYYNKSQLWKTENELRVELGRWQAPTVSKIDMMLFEDQGQQYYPKLSSIDRDLVVEVDKALDSMKGSIFFNLDESVITKRGRKEGYGKMREMRALEGVIDLIEGERFFIRIKRTDEPWQDTASRLLQSCFCAEVYLSPEEVFVDLRTLFRSTLLPIALKYLPFDLSHPPTQIVDEVYPCKLNEGVKTSDGTWQLKKKHA